MVYLQLYRLCDMVPVTCESHTLDDSVRYTLEWILPSNVALPLPQLE